MSSKIYVVFEDDCNQWWSRFLKKGIKHCYVVKPTEKDFIIYGKNDNGVDLFTVEDLKSIIDKIYTIKSYVPVQRKRSLFMLNTCVGYTKQMLGINNPFILTPYQLLKYLRKHEIT